MINNSKIAQISAKYTMHSTGKIESYLARANDLEKVLVQKWLNSSWTRFARILNAMIRRKSESLLVDPVLF